MKRTVNAPDNEPEQSNFQIPSEKEHLFQVVDVFTMVDEGNKFNLDNNTIIAKCEICGGDEEGRTLLQRLSLDDQWKGFFATRLFLKAIGQPHKGQIEIDTDSFIGMQFYATVIHNKSKDGTKTFANIAEYNFEKLVDQHYITKTELSPIKTDNTVAWDEDIK